MSDLFYYDPYQTAAVLEPAVVRANTLAKPNFLQQWFPSAGTWDLPTVNFDKEFMTRNLMSDHVAPRVDASIVDLQGYTTQEMRFGYMKEGVIDPDWEQLQGRLLGEAFNSSPDYWARFNKHVSQQLVRTEEFFSNRFEYVASSLVFNGTYLCTSDKHPTIFYDFKRTKVTTEAALLKGYVPEVNLVTLNANGGAGKRAWNATGGTKAPTPYLDVATAVKTVLRRSGVDCIVMSSDVYPYLEADLKANYKDASDNTLRVEKEFDLRVFPILGAYQRLVYQRMLPMVMDGSGSSIMVPVYTYEAVYHDRKINDIDLAERNYVPNGKFAVLPSKDKGMKLYGRILNPNAQFEAIPRYINTWKNEKTGMREAEVHTNFLMGMKDPDVFACWTVLA
jgi:hypothetical protein